MNKRVGEREVVLCGEKILLRPSFENLVRAEDILGKSMVKFLDQSGEQEFYISDYVSIIFACQEVPEKIEKKSFNEIGSMFIAENDKSSIYVIVLGMINLVLRGDKKKEVQEQKEQ